jgi:hypothetical protein
LAGVWIPRSKGSGTIGGQEVADAIAAAVGCAKRRIVVVVVHLFVKKIGVIRATFLTSACQESKMTKEGGCD